MIYPRWKKRRRATFLLPESDSTLRMYSFPCVRVERWDRDSRSSVPEGSGGGQAPHDATKRARDRLHWHRISCTDLEGPYPALRSGFRTNHDGHVRAYRIHGHFETNASVRERRPM